MKTKPLLIILSLFQIGVISTSARAANTPDVQISAGGLHTCALDDEGVKCWGWNEDGQTNAPPLINPRAISAGGWHTCALDDSGVKCWGSNGSGQTNVPSLRNPQAISAGEYFSCALDDEGVKCWGENKYGQTNVPSLRNPRAISAGVFHTCALDDEGVKCWGVSKEGQTNVPSLRNPRAISAGGDHTCALDDEGVKCWGKSKYGQTNAPENLGLAVTFNLKSLEINVRKLSRYMYRYKEGFFKGIATELEKTPLNPSSNYSSIQYRIALARYVFLELMGPVIETTTSSIVQTKVLPNYQAYLESVRKEMGINSFDSIELIEPVFKALLSTTTLALQDSKDYLLSLEDAKEQAQMLSELKALEASQSGKDFLNILNTHRRLITSMAESPKLDGFGALLEKVRIYLERKV